MVTHPATKAKGSVFGVFASHFDQNVVIYTPTSTTYMAKGNNNMNAKQAAQQAKQTTFSGDIVVRFEEVSFEYSQNKPILEEVSLNVRRGTKVTIMGQNGAGKSTIFGLILGADHAGNTTEGYKPESGDIHIAAGATVATARQVMPRDQLDLTVREFFSNCFKDKIYDIDPRIDAVLEVVNLQNPKHVAEENPEKPSKAAKKAAAHPEHKIVDLKDRIVKTFSGGQQARLLLASALIQDPDILLLDEPTNNLDKAGIEHLTQFLVNYEKTCLVISHDAEFLNAFTHGVLYLDVYTRKVEQYVGDYHDVVGQITLRIEKENMKNAQLAKEIQENKDKANFFAMKGGQMRLVAKRMRERAEELEDEKVDVRREDKTIREFTIPVHDDLSRIPGDLIAISKYSMLDPKTHKPLDRVCKISLRKKNHLLLAGPNGIGKSTLLQKIYAAAGTVDESGTVKIRPGSAEAKEFAEIGITISDGVRVGYYRQDFSMMDFNDTVYESLEKIIRATEGRLIETELRAVAASFLITADSIHTKIGSLSEGQKGLVAFARLVLQKPGLLIMDEPTNHINFRHLPVIAKALSDYEGALILVSHVPDFVEQIRIDEVLEMGK
ncbi:MAG: transporter family protein ATP-binding cassette, subfamily er 3 [Candidatus Taylorbacteria bacterium]|nr:transporter family protein ATP-binding cassette, subfamily er 3 [Candidatus Taylorbacteria bacterium]